MIENAAQPRQITVNDAIKLVRYYPLYRKTLAWYQDLTLCKQVDNIDTPYDLDRLKRMYRYLSKNGECYYIKFKDHGRWRLVGDISLCHGAISIVICHEYQNQRIGRAAIGGILGRAKEIGWKTVEAQIYAFNKQSQRAFEAAGFKKIGEEQFLLDLASYC